MTQTPAEAVQEFEAQEIPETQELVEIPPEPEARPAEPVAVSGDRPARRKKK